MDGGTVQDVLAFDQAGPVAVLVLVVFFLYRLFHWALMKLIEDKDAQIVQLNSSNDRLREEIAKTLDTILTAIKDQAAERRQKR
jgi:F0F1-type ATP synthase membrane subunit b/b'